MDEKAAEQSPAAVVIDTAHRRPGPEVRSPAMRILDDYLARALSAGASDLHLEPDGHGLRARLRIDGHLQTLPPPPANMIDALVTRTRLLAGVDLADRRLPQDGRFAFARGGRTIDVRAAFMPVHGGEKITLRFLDRQHETRSFHCLGLTPPQAHALRITLHRAHGMLIVCGPTGSGKTTTLYAALELLRRPDVSILTVEDPVERCVTGVSQVSVDDAAGRTFATTLRHALRQDPDVLMIGEIRDGDSARIACRAALTGHLVLSTLHASDSRESIVRLVEMGIPRYLVTATVHLVLAQRLLRQPCHTCRVVTSPDDSEAECFGRAGLPVPERLARAVGCPHCGGSGFRGRNAIFEVLVLDRSRPSRDLDRNSLLVAGLSKAAALETTVAEVLAHCPETPR